MDVVVINPLSAKWRSRTVCLHKSESETTSKWNWKVISIRGDQGQNRQTDQPGRKWYPGGEKQAISLRNRHPAAGIVVVQPVNSRPAGRIVSSPLGPSAYFIRLVSAWLYFPASIMWFWSWIYSYLLITFLKSRHVVVTKRWNKKEEIDTMMDWIFFPTFFLDDDSYYSWTFVYIFV